MVQNSIGNQPSPPNYTPNPKELKKGHKKHMKKFGYVI
jgi:hypothetical protein